MFWFRNLKVRRKLLIAFIVIITLASGTALYIIAGMKNVNGSYEDAMDMTNRRVSCIFSAKDHFSKATTILREVYYPENTRDDLNRLYAELDGRLRSLTNDLIILHELALPDVQKQVEQTLPLVEKFRSDAESVVSMLLAVNIASIDNQDYRNVLIKSQDKINDIGFSYANEMAATIASLSDMAIKTLEKLRLENSAHADKVLIVSICLLATVTVISFMIAFLIANMISKPLAPLSAFMKKAGATGNITLSPADIEVIGKYSKFRDEIGDTISGAASFIKHVSGIAQDLESVASGDLTVETTRLSDDDVMALSIVNMITSLNNMFAEIQANTDQVAIGSKQVAVGAQTLAQGSTEQAASIQQLSGSIAEIAQRTRENADTADKTSKLSERIKERAEKGSRQMDEMIAAVKAINDASQSISKIIKTIDDIAFQTNILALNAAVEAARAGQHGKGFAVVAEEVRNLAAKSAEAAKETGDMIQNSMEKAEFGSNIAGETAQSLTEIVTGINESSRFIEEIARASEDQTVGISQINIGIDQVAQVVAQNSATAEESAAASQEMSSQASALEELLSLFKMKSSNNRNDPRRSIATRTSYY